MSLESFKLLDDTTIDTSIIKLDFMKIYHQRGAQLVDSNQRTGFVSGENNNYHRISIAYLELDITLRKIGGDYITFFDGNIDEPLRLVKSAFAYAFSIVTLSTTGE